MRPVLGDVDTLTVKRKSSGKSGAKSQSRRCLKSLAQGLEVPEEKPQQEALRQWKAKPQSPPQKRGSGNTRNKSYFNDGWEWVLLLALKQNPAAGHYYALDFGLTQRKTQLSLWELPVCAHFHSRQSDWQEVGNISISTAAKQPPAFLLPKKNI